MGGEGVTDNHGVKWMLSFIVALSRSLALGSLLALLAASPCRAEVVLIQQAEVSEGPALTAAVPAWRAQALPDDWGRTRPEFGGELWYRIPLDATGLVMGNQVPAIYVERVCSNLAVYLNGSLVGSGGKLTLPYSRNCFTPQMFMLPQALLKPGVNTILIQVVGYPLRQVSAAQRSSGLSVVRIGASEALRPLYEQALWWNITLPKVITALLGAFTVFIGALWLTRPKDTYYGYFTLWIGWWTLNTTRLYVIDPPLPGPWIEMLVPATAPLCVTGFVLFLMRFIGRNVGWINQVLWWQMLIIPLVFLWGGQEQVYPLARWAYYWLVPQFIVASFWFMAVSWRVSRRDFWLFSVILITMVAITLVELAAAFLALPLKMHLGHLGGPITLLPLCLRLIWVFSDNLRRSEELNVELERRVTEKSSEIARNFAELSSLRAREAVQDERQRIASDLHDDLGAKLLSIAHESRRVDDHGQLAGMARQALDEMRLSVRGMVSEPLRAAEVLGDWRAETVQRLAAAGFTVDWQAAEPPPGLLLPARTQVQLTRVLREAVSNLIRHSGGRHCRVVIGFSQEAMALTVEDDGCGMDAAALGAKGNGLGGIERRVRILGGHHTWRQGPLGGACLDVRVPIAQETGGAAGDPDNARETHPLTSSNATRPDR
jgi:signal transduction histidine kinase